MKSFATIAALIAVLPVVLVQGQLQINSLFVRLVLYQGFPT